MILREMLNYVFNLADAPAMVEIVNNSNSALEDANVGFIYGIINEKLREVYQKKDYIKKDSVKTVDKKIYNGFFKTEPFEILSVKQKGKNVKFEKQNGYVELKEDGEFEVEYRTYPEINTDSMDWCYDGDIGTLYEVLSKIAIDYKEDIKIICGGRNG